MNFFCHEERNREKGIKEGKKVGQSSLGNAVTNLTHQYSGASAVGVHDLIWYPRGSPALDLAESKPSSAKPEKSSLW